MLERLLERASEDTGQLTLVQGEFHQMPRRRYGLIYASRSLPFATPENWRNTWRIIGNRVAVNGLVAAVLYELLPAGKRVLVSADEARNLLRGFEIVSLDEHQGEGRRVRDGSTFNSHELVLIARKARTSAQS